MKIPSNELLFVDYKRENFCKIIDSNNAKYTNIIEYIMGVTSRPEAFLSDRTNTFKGRYKIKTTPIPEINESFNLSFDEIATNRAKQLLNDYDELFVCWSGGIDSTYILVQLINNTNDISKIKVILTEDSVKEYPNFFKRYIDGKIKWIETKYHYSLLRPSEKQCIINGRQIAQLFGGTFASEREDWNTDYIPWLEQKFLYDIQKNWFFDTIQSWIKKSPYEIKSIFDFVWWTHFTLRWDDPLYTPLSRVSNRDIDSFSKYEIFYRTEDFERWSMKNSDKKIITGSKDFKYILKNYIYQFDKDDEYMNSKISEGSGGKFIRKTISRENNTPVIVDDNFQFFTKKEVQENTEQFKKFINPLNSSEWFPGEKLIFKTNEWITY